MKSWARILLVLLLAAIACGAAQSPSATKVKPDWVLVWSDEFNAPDGSPPDPAKWTLELGGNGYGNNELEYYTDRPRNIHLDKGNLLITSNDGDTYVVKAGPVHEILATNPLGEPVFASLALAGDSIYIRSDQALYRIRQTPAKPVAR